MDDAEPLPIGNELGHREGIRQGIIRVMGKVASPIHAGQPQPLEAFRLVLVQGAESLC